MTEILLIIITHKIRSPLFPIFEYISWFKIFILIFHLYNFGVNVLIKPVLFQSSDLFSSINVSQWIGFLQENKIGISYIYYIII